MTWSWIWFVLGVVNGGLILAAIQLLRIARELRVRMNDIERETSQALNVHKDRIWEFKYSKADNTELGELRREMKELAAVLGVEWTVFGQGWKKGGALEARRK